MATKTKKKPTYLRGLGDLFIKAQRQDDFSLSLDVTEESEDWTAVGGTTVAESQVQVYDGSKSILVSAVNADNDGVEYTPATALDLSEQEDGVFKTSIFPTVSGTLRIEFQEGANYERHEKAVTAGEWNTVVLDLSAPASVSGTTDWSTIDAISFTISGSADDFYIDGGLNFADSIADLEREESIRIGCVNEIGLERSDETIELRCSRNEVEETDVISTSVTLSATVYDFNPEGLSLMTAGKVTTDSVTQFIEDESFTVPASGPYTYTLEEAANYKTGGGYGLWIAKALTGETLQEASAADLVKPGFYYVDSVTGEVTFHASEAGIAMKAFYTVVTTNGKTLEVKSDAEFLEFSMLFNIRGSNNKKGLYVFPRLKASTQGLDPAKDDFWTWNFEANVLADPVSGNYYDLHVIEG